MFKIRDCGYNWIFKLQKSFLMIRVVLQGTVVKCNLAIQVYLFSIDPNIKRFLGNYWFHFFSSNVVGNLLDSMETLLANVINGLCVFKFNGVFKYCHLVLHSMFVRANHLFLSETLSFDSAKSCLFLIPL